MKKLETEYRSEYDGFISKLECAVRSRGSTFDLVDSGKTVRIDGERVQVEFIMTHKPCQGRYIETNRKPTGFRISVTKSATNRWRTQSYPRPKAGFDPEKFATLVIGMAAALKARDAREKTNHEKALAAAKIMGRLLQKHDIVSPYVNGVSVESDRRGVKLTFDGLDEKQADAILAAAIKVGVLKTCRGDV